MVNLIFMQNIDTIQKIISSEDGGRRHVICRARITAGDAGDFPGTGHSCPRHCCSQIHPSRGYYYPRLRRLFETVSDDGKRPHAARFHERRISHVYIMCLIKNLLTYLL